MQHATNQNKNCNQPFNKLKGSFLKKLFHPTILFCYTFLKHFVINSLLSTKQRAFSQKGECSFLNN